MSAMAGTEPGPPFFAGFEKWVNTLPIKLASWAFKIGELGFRLRRDSGIIHGAATSLSCLLSASRYSTENGGRLPRFFRPPIEPYQKMGKLQQSSPP